MAASYESVRRDRRYEVDARGVAEFGPHRVLQRFIPWGAVKRIEFAHAPQHKQVRWSVRAADGSRIRPTLEYANSLDCYNAAVRAWRERVPHACRADFGRVYRRFRRAHALVHLYWLIPTLFVYATLWLSYALKWEVPWDAIGAMSQFNAVMFVLCLLQNLLYLKDLRLDFDRWYARVEESSNEPASPSPVPSSAILRWIFPTPTADFAGGPINDEERRAYHRWEVGSLVLIVLLVPLLGCAWCLGLTRAASLFHRADVATRFLVQPSWVCWLIPAFLLGVVTGPIPIIGLNRVWLGRRYRRFARLCMERVGFDGRRLFVCFTVIVFAGSAVLFFGAATGFSRFTDAGIEIQRPFSFHSVYYAYARVRSIEHRATCRAPIGTIISRPHHVIEFDDHTSWSSREGLRDPVPAVDGEIARFVSQQSKRPIIEQP
jgi:hypothetical protein